MRTIHLFATLFYTASGWSILLLFPCLLFLSYLALFRHRRRIIASWIAAPELPHLLLPRSLSASALRVTALCLSLAFASLALMRPVWTTTTQVPSPSPAPPAPHDVLF